MIRSLVLAGIVLAWSVTPLLKRVVMDHMAAEDAEGPSPVRTFVALSSAGCAIATALLAWPTGPMVFIERLPAVGWTVLLVSIAINTVAGIALADLLRTGNPGLVMVYLNAGTNVCTFLFGTVFYGQLTWDNVAGALLVAAGIALLR
jgi:hypothetical protein